ncbi:TspO/MBR family protein [Aestuariivirga sp.]|uniref:TspO/MBR family protein n=1 Tax=Aestuariivirga sp. TaxID=2650926 RepID=UPI0039E6E81E
MIPQDPFYAGLLGGALFCVVLAIAGGVLTRIGDWYHALRKPAWKPPDWAFGPIWTIVFFCLTFAIAHSWAAASLTQRPLLLVALAANGLLNIAWSGIFFMMRNPPLAFIELVIFWVSIVTVILVMSGISRTAVLLTLPYLAWVTTAGVLNYQIVRLNRP